jgi:hypothetical protein
MSILILFRNIFTRNPTTPYSLKNISGTHFFYTKTSILIYITK